MEACSCRPPGCPLDHLRLLMHFETRLMSMAPPWLMLPFGARGSPPTDGVTKSRPPIWRLVSSHETFSTESGVRLCSFAL